ncbi:serine hydrolase domain-containing protein [Pedobacter caeni]|uniref:CubicO group peptidase, beta-lactamase class C family n=1 Tax=Pedobacter caeni TaxID=288992 RepID=A0A1M5LBE2_9SPHI|nr:serine hydrolase domain-containing protein [Pedobacter caeni]SHG62412.1 CubicO group peptidase, beta-lactamase class C family [Pedobacter caeni]
MKKISLIIFLCHCLITVNAQQQYDKAVNEQIARVETNLSGSIVIDGKPFTLEERMKHYNVAGVSVAVIDNYKMVWAKAYGYADKEENRKVTTNTMFEPGSISKSLNAVGILQLAQQGKLDLYQDINQYLLNWKFPYDTVSHGKKITTAQLLSHTAGLGVHGFPGYHRDSPIASVTDILDGRPPSNTEAVRSLTEPGKEVRYSGGGILITQQMLTDLSKQPYEQYMNEHVLGPLGMTNSSFHQPPSTSLRKKLATGYKTNGDEVPGKYFIYPEKAAAGLWTTPTDISKYIIEIQQAYQGKSSKVLNQEMVKLHLTPYKDDVALGTYIQNRNGEKYFVHSASNEGFTGYFLGGLTNGKGVALFVNSEDGEVLLELLNSVTLEYNWEGFRKPEQITTVPVNDTITSKYIGEYILDGFLSEIKKQKDGLYLWTNGISSKMYFTSSTEFRNLELGGAKAFTFDNAGTVTGYSNTINGRLRAKGQKINALDTLKAKPGQWGVLGRHLLETKNYDKAVGFLSKGLASEPSDSSLVRNLAHSYLFKGDLEQSIELYRRYLKSGKTEHDLRKSLKNDFQYLRNAGFDHSVIKKAGDILLFRTNK